METNCRVPGNLHHHHGEVECARKTALVLLSKTFKVNGFSSFWLKGSSLPLYGHGETRGTRTSLVSNSAFPVLFTVNDGPIRC